MTDRTHGPFKVGDRCVVVYVRDPSRSNWVGREVTITEAGFGRNIRVGKDMPNYITSPMPRKRADEPCNLAWMPDQLRRIDPDQYIRQETTDWSKCAWQPQRTEA